MCKCLDQIKTCQPFRILSIEKLNWTVRFKNVILMLRHFSVHEAKTAKHFTSLSLRHTAEKKKRGGESIARTTNHRSVAYNPFEYSPFCSSTPHIVLMRSNRYMYERCSFFWIDFGLKLIIYSYSIPFQTCKINKRTKMLYMLGLMLYLYHSGIILKIVHQNHDLWQCIFRLWTYELQTNHGTYLVMWSNTQLWRDHLFKDQKTHSTK